MPGQKIVYPEADKILTANEFRKFIHDFVVLQRNFFTITLVRHIGQGYNAVFCGQGGRPTVRIALVDFNKRIESTWVASDIIAVRLTMNSAFDDEVKRLIDSTLDNAMGSVMLRVVNGRVEGADYVGGSLYP